MAINNQIVNVDGDTQAGLVAALTSAFAEASGMTADETNTFWLDEDHSIGVRVSASSTYQAVFRAVYNYTKTRLISNTSGDKFGAFVYNRSADGKIFAFSLGGTSGVILRAAIITDTDGVKRIVDIEAINQAFLFSPKLQSYFALPLNTAANLNFFGVTLVRFPAYVTAATYDELYYVLSARELSWGVDGTIIADGNYYKIIAYASNGGALAFKVK